MVLALGIRLVIVFPTLLFIVGFSLKLVLDKKSFERVIEESNLSLFNDLFKNSTLMLAVNSIFLFMANGLIFIFQLRQDEIGIIAMISGVIFSICLIVGVFAEEYRVELIGARGIFGILGGELACFFTYDGFVEFARNTFLSHLSQEITTPTEELPYLIPYMISGMMFGVWIGSRFVILHKGFET